MHIYLIAKFDGVALVDLLKPQSSRFISFIENVFICLIKKELDGCKGIDLERDQYFQHSTKESTRAKWGTGIIGFPFDNPY